MGYFENQMDEQDVMDAQYMEYVNEQIKYNDSINTMSFDEWREMR